MWYLRHVILGGCERIQPVTSRMNEHGLRVVSDDFIRREKPLGFLRELVSTSQEDIKALEFAVKQIPFLVKC